MTSKEKQGFAALAAVITVGMIGYWALRHSKKEAPLPMSSPVAPTAQNEIPAPAAPLYPIPAESELPKETLPADKSPTPHLDESDPSIAGGLRDLFGSDRVASLFHLRDIVRRIVVTIDNAPKRQQPAQEFLPIKLPEPGFLVAGSAISPKNFARYHPYVELISSVDMAKLAALYIHYYPLFQSAYRDLGSEGYFNDRLIEVIDHLLDTPNAPGAIRVKKPAPHYKYKFEMDAFEALSFSQKILIRIGFENAQIVKRQLRHLRKSLAHFKK